MCFHGSGSPPVFLRLADFWLWLLALSPCCPAPQRMSVVSSLLPCRGSGWAARSVGTEWQGSFPAGSWGGRSCLDTAEAQRAASDAAGPAPGALLRAASGHLLLPLPFWALLDSCCRHRQRCWVGPWSELCCRTLSVDAGMCWALSGCPRRPGKEQGEGAGESPALPSSLVCLGSWSAQRPFQNTFPFHQPHQPRFAFAFPPFAFVQPGPRLRR